MLAPVMPIARRTAMLLLGCAVLGTGVALLLAADLGSDGYSTFVNGLTLTTGVDFWVMNLVVGVVLVALAALRKVRPGIGTVVQVVLVGVTVSVVLDLLTTPDATGWRFGLLVAAFPVLATGIALYLGSHTGAGPAEAAALAWDPPVPFRWSYSVVQGGGALGGWLLGATVGVGTLAVILLLGPAVDLAARLMSVDLHQEVDPTGRAVDLA
ncbi:hypothetical protein GCM10011376_29140 [Nocardioides flavus (ex Wang et al. 2016)]|uniref:Membrane protein YczE n=1 Tax=Nocardioides flavus (ex Wang et al. 2016) TaxID=2058780 RepID=A0ABQ3HQ61_9ACTN|nr:hypothetical protein [Nocardioides flavus (ex Wang et al. 2016)]GHE18304.1 hypothetical protein GCM10011376_29140 [Nocardioides flavus (ex Wang et al. 2016)]